MEEDYVLIGDVTVVSRAKKHAKLDLLYKDVRISLDQRHLDRNLSEEIRGD